MVNAAVLEVKKNPQYWEKDPEKKTYEWANQMVSLIRANWEPIVSDRASCEENMRILNNTQSLDKVIKKFKKGSDFVENTEWLQLAVLDRLKNILVSEFLTAIQKPTVEAVDVNAEAQRQKDRNMLKGRADIEQIMTQLHKRMGDPAFKLPHDLFEGNIAMFDQLGFDDTNEDDLSFFFQSFHRLWHEIDCEKLLHSLLNASEIEVHIEDLVLDILAKYTVAFRNYPSPFTGEIKWDYKNPLDMYAIKGKRKDFKDSAAIGDESLVLVNQFLDFVGPEFDFATHGKLLAQAINTTNSTNYSYVTKEGCWTEVIEENGSRYELTAGTETMLKYSVPMGYMEFKSIDRKTQKYNKQTKLFYPLTPKDKERPFVEDDKFELDVSEYQVTYKTHYLSMGIGQQMIFKFGPLYHQLTSGSYDEYSAFSYSVYQGRGKAPVRGIRPFLSIAHDAFYKMKWAIDESTPRVTNLHYDSIAQLITKLAPKKTDPYNTGNTVGGIGQQPSSGYGGQIDKIISHYRNSLIRMYTTPEVDGQKFGGNGRPHYQDEGGLDPLAPAMQTVYDWAVAQISAQWGIGALDALPTDPRDGYKNRLTAMQQARKATYFIPTMLEKVIKGTCTTSLMIAQDGIEAKTKVYEYLTDLIGTGGIASMKSLMKIPSHRYGMFVRMFANEQEAEVQRQEAFMAFERKEIAYEEYVILKNMDNPKDASVSLAYFRKRNEKKQRDFEQQKHTWKMEEIGAQNQIEINKINAKGYWELEKQKAYGEYYMRAHQTPADAAIQKKQMDIETNGQKMMERAEATNYVNEHKQRLKNQEALPITSSEPAAPLTGGEQA